MRRKMVVDDNLQLRYVDTGESVVADQDDVCIYCGTSHEYSECKYAREQRLEWEAKHEDYGPRG